MNWKKLISHKHHPGLSAHHRYQLEVIFLFAAGIFLFVPYYTLIQEYQLDMQTWQWYFFFPWMAFYIIYSLKTRAKIPKGEEKSPLKRPIVHWVLLGIGIILLELQPTDLGKLRSIDLAFVILSIFVADGYWDFRRDR